MRQAMTVKGLQRLERRLKSIPENVRTAVRAEMGKTADEIVARMKQRVAEDTGLLESTIGWTWGAAAKGAQTLVQVRASGLRAKDTITIFAGGDATTRWVRNTKGGEIYEYDYALAIEFGTKNITANPFFFVTWREFRRRVRSRNRAAIRKAIAQS